MRKIFKFLMYLLPWFISSIILKTDTYFYDSLNKPFFAPTSIVFVIVWIILYFIIAIALYRNNNKSFIYYKSLIINYFSNQIYPFLFFTIKSPFIAFIDSIVIFISSLFLYNEIKSKWIIPYIIWNLFTTILVLSIYLMNI